MYKGKTEISVTLFFETDLTEDEIETVLEEVKYKFEHYMIQDTRINGELDPDCAM